jgi:hypothetical protein
VPRATADFLKEIRETRGDEALTDRPSIALAVRMVPGHSLENPTSLFEPSMLVYPVLDPILNAVAVQAGAHARGSMTWQIGLGEDADPGVVRRILETAAPGTIMPETWLMLEKGARDVASHYRFGQNDWNNAVPQIPLINGLFRGFAQRHAGNYNADPYMIDDKVRVPASFGLITYKYGHGSLFFKAFTNKLEIPTELEEEIGKVDLNLRQAGRLRKEPTSLRPAAAIAVCEWAHSMGLEIVDADGSNALAEMRQLLAYSVVAWTRPGRPAQAKVSIGTKVDLPSVDLPSELVTTAVATLQAGTIHERDINRASRINNLDSVNIADLQKAGIELTMHPAVADMAALAAAEAIDDHRLRPRQRFAVGLHLATDVGYANFSDPGAGKTIMTLEGMRRRASRIAVDPARIGKGYRGLIIAEANVREQFSNESRLWFPAALTLTVEKASQVKELAELLDSAGNYPVMVVTSYALASQVSDFLAIVSEEAAIASLFEDDAIDPEAEAEAQALNEAVLFEIDTVEAKKPAEVAVEDVEETVEILTLLNDDDTINLEATEEPHAPATLGSVLASASWDDIIADEAAGLRNMNSKQSKALWGLRANAQVGLALTGTPYSRSADDIGAIIAWVRGDRHMFRGISLDNEFDLSQPEDVAEFGRAFGPVIFRMDESEFADELPTEKDPLIIELLPTPAEKRLADGARYQLKRNLDELIALIAQLEEADPNDPEVAEIRKDLITTRGAVLGGGQLARMAASDPAALIGSTSAGAMLLESNGLISDANREPGTKRTAVVKMCAERIANGERIVLFTEFSTVARGLISDLRAVPLRVGEILGGGGKQRDRDVEAFQKGELDIVVCTSAGERGLNLQTATTLIHYDLAWSPTSIIQRTGRIKRIGSTAASIQVIFPIMKGTIEERVVAVVVARAIAMMQTLDGARGVTTTSTGFGRTFGRLIGAANYNELTGRDAKLLAITQEILAA